MPVSTLLLFLFVCHFDCSSVPCLLVFYNKVASWNTELNKKNFSILSFILDSFLSICCSTYLGLGDFKISYWIVDLAGFSSEFVGADSSLCGFVSAEKWKSCGGTAPKMSAHKSEKTSSLHMRWPLTLDSFLCLADVYVF